MERTLSRALSSDSGEGEDSRAVNSWWPGKPQVPPPWEDSFPVALCGEGQLLERLWGAEKSVFLLRPWALVEMKLVNWGCFLLSDSLVLTFIQVLAIGRKLTK